MTPNTTLLKVQHTSLQFSDGPAQQEADVKTLFETGHAFPIKTCTEAGPETDYYDLLQEYAHMYQHRIHIMRSNVVIVDKEIIKRGSWRTDEIMVEPTGNVAGPGHDSAFPVVTFDHADARMGTISYAALHYPTHGWRPGDPNIWVNKKYAKYVAREARKLGKGQDLFFGAGDFNMPDRKLDWFFGRPLTSMADELNRHQNSGHGDIDGFFSYNRDGRVKAKWFNVLDDNELPMFIDHYACRGAWEITHLSVD